MLGNDELGHVGVQPRAVLHRDGNGRGRSDLLQGVGRVGHFGRERLESGKAYDLVQTLGQGYRLGTLGVVAQETLRVQVSFGRGLEVRVTIGAVLVHLAFAGKWSQLIGSLDFGILTYEVTLI